MADGRADVDDDRAVAKVLWAAEDIREWTTHAMSIALLGCCVDERLLARGWQDRIACGSLQIVR